MTGRIVERDLAFSEIPGFRPLTLDLHRPAAALDPHRPETASQPLPLIVFVHGGGWRLGSRRAIGPNFDTEETFDRMVDAGFAVASVDYRLSGEAVFPAQVDDLRAALGWLRSVALDRGLDAARIVLFGESAGATIAALAALESTAEVAGVVDWYGPSNLVSMAAGLSAQDAAGTRETGWLGVSALDDPGRARDASPVFQVHAGAPPFLIAHGLADRFVPYSQSEELSAALEDAGVPVDFRLVDGADHMWGGDGVDTAALLEQALAFAARVTAIHHLTKEPA